MCHICHIANTILVVRPALPVYYDAEYTNGSYESLVHRASVLRVIQRGVRRGFRHWGEDCHAKDYEVYAVVEISGEA